MSKRTVTIGAACLKRSRFTEILAFSGTWPPHVERGSVPGLGTRSHFRMLIVQESDSGSSTATNGVAFTVAWVDRRLFGECCGELSNGRSVLGSRRHGKHSAEWLQVGFGRGRRFSGGIRQRHCTRP